MKKTVSILTALSLLYLPVVRSGHAQEATVQVQQNVEESKASKVLGALKNGANKVAGGVKFVGNKACQGTKFVGSKACQGVKTAGQKVVEHPGVTAAVVAGAAVAGSAGYVGYNLFTNRDETVELCKKNGFSKETIKGLLKMAFGVKGDESQKSQDVDSTTPIVEENNDVNATASSN